MRSLVLGLVLAASMSLPGLAAEPEGPAALIDRTDAIRITVQDRLAAKSMRDAAQQIALAEYYSVSNHRPLWVDESGLTPRGKAVMAEVAKADDYGLRARDYRLPDVASFNAADPNAVDWLAGAEIKISIAVLEYAKDARGGRLTPLSLSKNLDPTLYLPNPAEVIGFIAIRSDPAAYLRSFQPTHPQFEALRQKLIQARKGDAPVAAPKPDVVIMPPGPILKLGVKNPQVALLRTRLKVPAKPGAKENVFDKDLRQAVRQFQRAHGASADGIVGSGTRRMLNGQPAPRQLKGQQEIDLLMVNMERWRWLPHDMGPFYVTVNIPEFRLRIMEDGEKMHEARVVVGKTNKQTPVFSDEMEEIVFRPNWFVPNSIKTEEIAPSLRRSGGFFSGGGWDTSVFQRHDLRIRGVSGRDIDPASIDWGNTDIRRYELYQPPGPRNVLGMMKFRFPNKHDVYLHDTTQKHLFANAVRLESHGCMRLQNPEQVATILLSRDQGWTASQVASAVAGRDDNKIILKNHVPVYVTYFTAQVADDGSLTQYRDVYRHDTRMLAALSGRAAPRGLPGDEQVAVQARQRPANTRRRRQTGFNDITRSIFDF
jgi:murein L,D-transpeptidase YcbB/YkuD